MIGDHSKHFYPTKVLRTPTGVVSNALARGSPSNSGARDAVKIVRCIGSESLPPEIVLDSLVGHRGPVHP
jgi:hypothetical protein